MSFTYRPGLAFVTSAFVVLAACGRGPIGGTGDGGAGHAGNKMDGSTGGKGGTTGAGARAGTTGTGSAGVTGGATGVAGTGVTGAAGTGFTGVAGTGVVGAAGTGFTGGGGVTGVAGTGFTGASGSFGTAGVSGAAGTFAACMSGNTMCVDAFNASTCLPTGTWSNATMWCQYGCFSNVCRHCPPLQSTCDTTMTVQQCPPDGSDWFPSVKCANGCENGQCAPRCVPATSECVNDRDRRTCGPGGIWGAPITCENGCNSGTCNACEPFQNTCLTAKTGHQCLPDGTWDATFTCSGMCTNGQCDDCSPGATTCVDEKNVHSCNGSGTWDPPQACDAICFADNCHSCKAGQTQCSRGDAIQICGNDGEWGEEIICSNVCKAGACTSNPKKVFVTSTNYKGGDLGGLTGADAKCQARATAAGLKGTFRAWLSDATGSPQSRFTQDAGPYLLVTGGVVANNWTGLTSGNLRHAINVTELGGAPSGGTTICDVPVVWTDTDGGGNIADFSGTCGDWTDSTIFNSSFGTTASQSGWTQICSGGSTAATGCGALAPIYCFEQ